MNLNFFLGTAAELIKVYPVIHQALQQGHTVRVISSGQSRENFLMQYRDFRLPENILVTLLESDGDLRNAKSAAKWFLRAVRTPTARFLSLLACGENTFIIVHGDTLSTLAGAWLGWRSGVTIAHIEAGLRSPQLLNPFPEEITRRLVTHFARVHLAPDSHAEMNLRLAGARGAIINTGGNTLMDAVRLSGELPLPPREPYALVNIHRFENLNSEGRWSKILDTVMRASGNRKIIFVTHPQTQAKLAQDPGAMRLLSMPQIEIRERMPFSEFIGLLKASEFLISDGGSNQEECSYLGKPCLLLRESSERMEGLNTCCVLSRFNQEMIDRFLENPLLYQTSSVATAARPSQLVLNKLSTLGTL